MEKIISADFHFTSPLDNRIDREAYFERCWPNSLQIKKFEFVHFVSKIEVVFVTYLATMIDGKQFRNTEVFTLAKEQITNVEVYFGWSMPHPAVDGSFTHE